MKKDESRGTESDEEERLHGPVEMYGWMDGCNERMALVWAVAYTLLSAE